MGLVNLLKKIKNKTSRFRRRSYFTTPSHHMGSFTIPKMSEILGNSFYNCDVSEIEGIKNFEGPSKQLIHSQENASEVYGTKATFYLTNGSTSGVVASMLTVLRPYDKVLVARNCHKSVYSGLVLTIALPIWVMPNYNEDWGIYEYVNPNIIEQVLELHPDIKAIIITSPSYYGALCDVEKIARIARERNVYLIVDEAHGALYKFDKTIGTSAVDVQADFCIQSLHKTAGGVNPTALLHVGFESNIDINDVQKSLDLITTSSPSYPMLASIEATVDFLNSKKGKAKIATLVDDVERFKKRLLKLKNVHIYSQNNDITKILIKIDGFSGFEISDILLNRFNIEDELANEKSILFVCGIGTTLRKLNKLYGALKKISRMKPKPKDCEIEREKQVYPIMKYTPFMAKLLHGVEKPLIEALGCVSKSAVIPYPPASPLLLPGEVIQKWHIDNIDEEFIEVVAE